MFVVNCNVGTVVDTAVFFCGGEHAGQLIHCKTPLFKYTKYREVKAMLN